MIRPILLLSVLFLVTSAARASEFDDRSAAAIDRAVAAAIELKVTPGAVVVAGRAGAVLFEKPYGRMTYDPSSAEMTDETVFDLASLTKVIATATSVMVLAEQGKLSVDDPVSKHVEGMRVADKKEITIEQCLLHRGGFIGDNPLKDFSGTPAESFRKIYAAKLKYEPGTSFEYSDNSMLVLGELVRAVSGQSLDQFARENVFRPLGMRATTYNPMDDWKPRIAPTQRSAGDVGEVHDPRARRLGGVAGHAGVFGTGRDAARFCRMILGKGQLDGRRLLSEAAVEAMTRTRCITDPKDPSIEYCRGYGFDVDTKLSPAPRGERFEKRKTFGHTGYTGTSFWIDPHHDAFVVLLTNRVYPDDDAEIKMLRKRVATIVAEALLPPGE